MIRNDPPSLCTGVWFERRCAFFLAGCRVSEGGRPVSYVEGVTRFLEV